MQTVSDIIKITNNRLGCGAGLTMISLQTLIQEDRIQVTCLCLTASFYDGRLAQAPSAKITPPAPLLLLCPPQNPPLDLPHQVLRPSPAAAALLNASCSELSPRPIPAGVVASSEAHLRMSGCKASGKQRRDTGSRRRAAAAAGASPHAQGGNAPLFDGGTAGGQRRADALRHGLPHLSDPASLQGKNAGKRPEGTGTTENGEQPAAQKKWTRTTSQATTTQTRVADRSGIHPS